MSCNTCIVLKLRVLIAYLPRGAYSVLQDSFKDKERPEIESIIPKSMRECEEEALIQRRP